MGLGDKDTPIFPPVLEAERGYNLSQDHYLGTAQVKRLFAVTFRRGIFSKRSTPLITLHAGPDKGDAVLATVDNKLRDSRPVPKGGSDGNDHENSKNTEFIGVNRGNSIVQARLITCTGRRTNARYRFAIPCKKEGQEEMLQHFEWQSSSEPDIKAIGSSGFNLVYISGDQEEVVARLGLAKSFTSKRYTLCFVGEGLTGRFGEAWEVATVAAAIRVYQLEIQRLARVAATA